MVEPLLLRQLGREVDLLPKVLCHLLTVAHFHVLEEVDRWSALRDYDHGHMVGIAQRGHDGFHLVPQTLTQQQQYDVVAVTHHLRALLTLGGSWAVGGW